MRKRFTVWPVLFVVMLLGVRSETSSQGRRFMVNKLAVRQVEMGYRLGASSLRARLHLESGEAIEYELSRGTDVDYFFELTRVLSSGGRMFAEVTDGELVSIQIAVP